MRNRVCAIGYSMGPLASFIENRDIAGQFKIVGTGFLVREEVVITCRHVIDDLERESSSVPKQQRWVLFIVDQPFSTVVKNRVRAIRNFGFTPRQVRGMYPLRDRRLDIGFIEFRIVHPQHFSNVEPAIIGSPRTIRLSEEIAVFGYPHAHNLLEKEGRVSRWGPVLQQGWISGISPFDGLGMPDEFLLDLRAAPGISGSPVFRRTGTVCGILHEGIPNTDRSDALTTTAFAQPISNALLGDWLAEFDLNRDPDD